MDDNIKNMEDIENKPSGQNPENSVEEFNNESTENVSDESAEEVTENSANEDTSEKNTDEVTENRVDENTSEETKEENTESEFDTKERKPLKNLGKVVISVVAVAMVATTAYAVLNPVL